MLKKTNKLVSFEPHLNKCKNVITLKICPNFYDYTLEEVELIKKAKKLYFPTIFYADLFNAMNKITFPSYHTYKFALDKIKQSVFFEMNGIPHPKTRVFYGKNQKKEILDYFKFPFIAKIPRGSSMGKGVFMIKNKDALDVYLSSVSPAYIQEYLYCDNDLRFVVIGKRIALAYWRIGPEGEFRNNVSLGGKIDFNNIPEEAKNLALYTSKKCYWDNVGIDIICHKGEYYVIEGNMKYGKKGLTKAGIDYKTLLQDYLIKGYI